MNQLSEEQQQRLNEIRESLTAFRPASLGASLMHGYAKELLDLLDSDSQAAGANYSKLAHEIISEYNSADDPGLGEAAFKDYLIPDGKDAAVARFANAVQKMVDNNAGPTFTTEGTGSHILVRTEDFKAIQKALEKLP